MVRVSCALLVVALIAGASAIIVKGENVEMPEGLIPSPLAYALVEATIAKPTGHKRAVDDDEQKRSSDWQLGGRFGKRSATSTGSDWQADARYGKRSGSDWQTAGRFGKRSVDTNGWTSARFGKRSRFEDQHANILAPSTAFEMGRY